MTELQPLHHIQNTESNLLAQRLQYVQALLLDWDGVFNDGIKSVHQYSGFSETDAMGLNMLRYGLWKRNQEMPFFYIISGEDNPTAWQFVQREHFTGLYIKIKDKRKAVEEIAQRHNIEHQYIACIYDDINDLSMASICGLRFLVGRESNPLFVQYAIKNGFCDYVTKHSGDKNAIREICELMLGGLNLYDVVITERMLMHETYIRYFTERNSIKPMLYQ
ncbi:MAG: phosphatase [Bacteroidia bacterium]|nr:phosphatase [Bacteroidia bacterium]MDW8347412.1 phosphatase [Bacteroidia bacterium]